jgi:hypothetical protein
MLLAVNNIRFAAKHPPFALLFPMIAAAALPAEADESKDATYSTTVFTSLSSTTTKIAGVLHPFPVSPAW